jgi:hypothetical protein
MKKSMEEYPVENGPLRMSAAKKKASEAVVNFKEAMPFPVPSSAHHGH